MSIKDLVEKVLSSDSGYRVPLEHAVVVQVSPVSKDRSIYSVKRKTGEALDGVSGPSGFSVGSGVTLGFKDSGTSQRYNPELLGVSIGGDVDTKNKTKTSSFKKIDPLETGPKKANPPYFGSIRLLLRNGPHYPPGGWSAEWYLYDSSTNTINLLPYGGVAPYRGFPNISRNGRYVSYHFWDWPFSTNYGLTGIVPHSKVMLSDYPSAPVIKGDGWVNAISDSGACFGQVYQYTDMPFWVTKYEEITDQDEPPWYWYNVTYTKYNQGANYNESGTVEQITEEDYLGYLALMETDFGRWRSLNVDYHWRDDPGTFVGTYTVVSDINEFNFSIATPSNIGVSIGSYCGKYFDVSRDGKVIAWSDSSALWYTDEYRYTEGSSPQISGGSYIGEFTSERRVGDHPYGGDIGKVTVNGVTVTLTDPNVECIHHMNVSGNGRYVLYTTWLKDFVGADSILIPDPNPWGQTTWKTVYTYVSGNFLFYYDDTYLYLKMVRYDTVTGQKVLVPHPVSNSVPYDWWVQGLGLRVNDDGSVWANYGDAWLQLHPFSGYFWWNPGTIVSSDGLWLYTVSPDSQVVVKVDDDGVVSYTIQGKPTYTFSSYYTELFPNTSWNVLGQS